MLTEGPTPDPKCKLIISSFLTLAHVLDCLRMGGGGGGGGGTAIVILGCGWGRTRGLYHVIVCFFSCAFIFCSVTFSVLYLSD